MKKSKTDLFIICVPTREEPMGMGGWENRWAIDSLQRGREGGTEESQQRTGRDVAFIEGLTQCSLLAGQKVAPSPCATQTGLFSLKRQHWFFF